MSKTGKRIPISAAKAIASDFGYSQVIIHAYDGNTHIQHVTTFGKSDTDCENAAAGGNAIKKLLKWDEKLCNAKPSRQIRREKMQEVLRSLVEICDTPDHLDAVNIVRFVACAELARRILNQKATANTL